MVNSLPYIYTVRVADGGSSSIVIFPTRYCKNALEKRLGAAINKINAEK